MNRIEYGQWKSKANWTVGCLSVEIVKMTPNTQEWREAMKTRRELLAAMVEMEEMSAQRRFKKAKPSPVEPEPIADPSPVSEAPEGTLEQA